MAEPFYRFVWAVGSGIFWMSSRPKVLHSERLPKTRPYILAANHHSPYDVALMIRHTPAFLDFVSINEVFASRFVAWFYGSMGAFPIDRSRPDQAGVRTILDRLKRGRIVAMFPEGKIRRPPQSVTHGGAIRAGVGRLAQLSGALVVPCAVVNSAAYERLTAWLPHKRIRYALCYGEALALRQDLPEAEAATDLENRLKQSLIACYAEAAAAIDWNDGGSAVAAAGTASSDRSNISAPR